MEQNRDIIRVTRDGRVEVELSILTFVNESDGYPVAYCPALDLSECEDTLEDTKKYFAETLKQHIKDALKQGTFPQDLKAYGWETQDGEVYTITSNWETLKAQRPIWSDIVRNGTEHGEYRYCGVL